MGDLTTAFPRLCYLWVDSAYQGSFMDWVDQTLAWTVDVVVNGGVEMVLGQMRCHRQAA